ncbi:MAG: hypothetical protein Q4D79_11525 [Propionibacteriaceae bacterium]|nr:hypothetical protein [Propionibacteriaceae bacterium]
MKEKVRVLVIEDKADLAADAKREIEDAFEESNEIEVEVSVETDFDKGLSRVRARESDVIVLDVRRDASASVTQDDAAGQAVYREIQEACFAPVVFWTALPEMVNHERMSPLVTVVTKEETVKLPSAIQAAVESGALIRIRGIEQQVADVLRRHMWTELAPNWAEYTEAADSEGIVQVLLSRLARILDEDRDQKFTTHPSHRYVYPPASERRSPGDVLRVPDQDWWVVLTPACDFAQRKVQYVLLAKASPLAEHPKYQAWVSANAGSKKKKDCWKNLERDVLKATRGRFHFLPAFRKIPDLVIDLENVRAVEVDALGSFDWVASLVSPFAEALLVQYSHVRGRIGVPDLDSELVRQRLLDGQSTDS